MVRGSHACLIPDCQADELMSDFMASIEEMPSQDQIDWVHALQVSIARARLDCCIGAQEQAEADLFALQAALTALYHKRREVRRLPLLSANLPDCFVAWPSKGVQVV